VNRQARQRSLEALAFGGALVTDSAEMCGLMARGGR
jgi:hypothetical protein